MLPVDGVEPCDLVQNPVRIAVDPRRFCDVYIDDLPILALVHFSRLHLKDDFIPAQCADVTHVIGYGGVCKEMWDNVRTRGVGGQLDGKRGKLGFGVCRRVSLMLATVTGRARALWP